MPTKQRKTTSPTLATVKRSAAIARAQADKARADAECAAYQGIQNSYKGGVPTRTTEPWSTTTTYTYGTTGDRQQNLSARDRGNNAYDNNPVAQTLIDTECDHVIGDGLNYQPRTEDEAWNREAEDKYYEWLETASVRGSDILSGCELESELWKLSRIAGDVGWILVSRGIPDAIESRIQIVPAENIVSPDGMYADKEVYDGIRFDQFGAPKTFYVLNNSERDPARRFIPVMARDFVYFPHLAKSSAARGTSAFKTIFDLLAHLDRYVDGVSLAAWMATVFGIIFKQNNGAKQMVSLPLLPNSLGNLQKAITLENGLVKYIGTDEDVAQVQATQPMQQTAEFIRTMFRMLGQPFGMPLEVIAKDMSTCNFASARIGLLPFYRSCRKKTARFGYRWSRTIKWWLSRESHRSPSDPKKWKTPFPENYWAHDLLPNAFDYTDPVSEAQADQLQIDMGTKSHQMVIAERGRDKAKIVRERREWRDETDDLPQTRSTLSRDETVTAETDPEIDKVKGRADAYGVTVRAGAITPQTEDEDQFRTELKLPAMSKDAKKAWKNDKGVRRPITITQPDGGRPAPGQSGQPSDPDETNEDNQDANESNNGDGKLAVSR